MYPEDDGAELASDEDWTTDVELAADADGDTLPCPECGREVYEDSDQCPHCGAWIMPLAHGRSRIAGRMRLVAVVVIFAMLFWVIRGLLRQTG